MKKIAMLAIACAAVIALGACKEKEAAPAADVKTDAAVEAPAVPDAGAVVEETAVIVEAAPAAE